MWYRLDLYSKQGFGSGSLLEPGKMTHKNRKKLSKLQFLIKKMFTFFQLKFFSLQFLVIKTLDPELDLDPQ